MKLLLLTVLLVLMTTTSTETEAQEIYLAPYELTGYNNTVDQSLAGYQGDTLKFMLEYAGFKTVSNPEWATLEKRFFKANRVRSSEKPYNVLSYNTYYNLNVSKGYSLETLSVDLGKDYFGGVRVSYEANTNATKTELAIVYRLSEDRKRYCVMDQVTTRMLMLKQYNKEYCLTNEVPVGEPLVYSGYTKRKHLGYLSALHPKSIGKHMPLRDAACTMRYLGIDSRVVAYAERYDNDDCGYNATIIDEAFMIQAQKDGKVE